MLTPAEVAAEFEQRTWMPEHGLPDQRVKAIVQTRDGYIWVGTQNGLARFDGRRFSVFNDNNTPGFTSDDCVALAEGTDGALWIATRNGLFRKAGNHFAQVRQQGGSSDMAKLSASRDAGMYAIAGPELQRLSAGASAGGRIRLPEFKTVNAMLEDSAGALWVGTALGLLRHETGRDAAEPVVTGPGSQSLPTTALAETPDGSVWVVLKETAPEPWHYGHRAWLGCVKKGRWTRGPTSPHDPVDFESPNRGEFIVPDGQGGLWLSGTRNGIHRFRRGRFEVLPVVTKLAEDYPLCAAVDREGNLWIGMGNSGLQCWSRRKAEWHETGPREEARNTWTVMQARDGTVWVGTDGGVHCFQAEPAILLTNSPAPLRNVRALAQDADGVVWVGTMRDLHFCKDGQWSRFMLPGEWFETKIRTLLPAKEGGVWIGSVRGLSRLHGTTLEKYTQASGLPTDEVRALAERAAGGLWVGTFGGGLANFNNGRFETLTMTNGLSNNNVWALHEDADGALWIGTEHGLNRLKDGRVRAFTTEEGLPDNLVNAIAEDDWGRLWISHDRGIYWVRKAEFEEVAAGRRRAVRAVAQNDIGENVETNGQKSNPAVCKTRDGRLWFPTTKGALVMDPAKASFDQVTPITVIEQVVANGVEIFSNLPGDSVRTPIPLTNGLRLRPGGGRVVQVYFTANTFNAPETTQFRYRLRGLSDRWVDLGTRREVHFAGLKPGEYQFEIVARNHHGVWQETGTVLPLQLTPFYYQTWWFYAGSAVVLGGLITLGVRWRIRELRQIHELQRMNALAEQRRQIARDVHDDLGASLTHILQLSRAENRGLLPEADRESPRRRIATIAEEAVNNMAEIVWANNPEFDTLEDLAAYLREYAATYLASTSLKWRLDFPANVPARAVNGLLRRHVLLILKEALQNVVKHAEAGQVEVLMAIDERTLSLRIADDGRGLPVDGRRRFGNGLANMRFRVEELSGSFKTQSSPGGGTEIVIHVPLGSEKEARK